MQFVQAHTAFDMRHDHLPLAAFPPPPRSIGTPTRRDAVSLQQLGIASHPEWQIEAAFATRCPTDGRARAANLVFRGERSQQRYA